LNKKIAAANSHIPVDAMMAFSFLPLLSSRFPLDEFSHARVSVLVSGFSLPFSRNKFFLSFKIARV
jgi:hypothetical protein